MMGAEVVASSFYTPGFPILGSGRRCANVVADGVAAPDRAGPRLDHASGKHEAFVRGLGAETFIDYTKTAPEDVLHDVDLVVDAVGGAGASRFLRTLKRGGALLPIFPLGFDGHDAAAALGVTVSTTQVRSSGAQLGELAALLDAGTVRVAIDSTFALSQARQAHERAEQGHIQGKIVMTVE